MENEIVVAVKGVITHNNRVLIIQRSEDDEVGAGTWEFTGGKMDFGESLEEALIREAKEEAGLIIVVGKLLYATTFKPSEHRQAVILTYACTACGNAVVLSFEHKDYLWANKEQMMRLLPKHIMGDLNHHSAWEYIFNE